MAIENVVYVKIGDLNSKEGFRRITTVMNGSNEFEIGDIRLVQADNDVPLGGHWREYPEVWGFLGKATITLEDIDTKERKVYQAEDGTRIFIPPRVASKIEAYKGTSIVTCSPKSDRERQTHRYEFV
jgi:hypothetical protein